MNDSHGVASQLSCVGLIIQLLAWKAVLSLSVTHINARTQTHACRCEMNLNHVKALGNEEEPCFCFHKQLLCFRSTARLGGGWMAEAWELPSVCSLDSLFSADVADSHCVAWTPVTGSECVSRCVQEELSWITPRQVFELLSVFAAAHQRQRLLLICNEITTGL